MTKEYHSRVEVFKALAVCYAEPDPDLTRSVKKICNGVPQCYVPCCQGAEDLRQTFLASSLHRLRVDHAQLFVGPFKLTAPPFGSVYLEQRQTLMGESTQKVKELYRQAGLEMEPEFNSPPDHIAAELEFLAYLFILQDIVEPGDVDKQRVAGLCSQFLEQHLGAWIGPFTSLVEKGAGTNFYKSLARMSRQLVKLELSAHLQVGQACC